MMNSAFSGRFRDLNQQVWEFLLSGGVFMVLIVLCSLISAGIVLHRLLSLQRESVMPVGLVEKLQTIASRTDASEIGQLRNEAEGSDTALGEILTVALEEEFESYDEASGSTEAVAREEVLRLQSGLSVLEDVITIAPLLGLLGTVSGLVSVFAELGVSDGGNADPTVLAGGIARALNTTIAGLAVAVPTVVARSFFHKKIEAMAVRMEVLVGRALHVLHRRYEGSAAGLPPEHAASPTSLPSAPPPPEPPVIPSAGGRATPQDGSEEKKRAGHPAMKFVAPRRSNPVVPIVSLIDILAILLIFFIFTTTFKKRESLVNVSLPRSSEMASPEQPEERVSLSVTEDRRILLGDDEVALEELGEVLQQWKRSAPESLLEMRADEEVPLGFLVQVWDEASKAGVKVGEVPLRIQLRQEN